ncbi:unnamed protein product [Brassica oleracea]
MEFLPAYEGLTKLISVEDDIRNWCLSKQFLHALNTHQPRS